MEQPSAQAVEDIIGLMADFTPGLGDAKGIYEAYQAPTVGSVLGAAVGLFPIAGDVAKQVLTHTDEVAGAVKGVEELKPTLILENPRNLLPTQTKSEMSGSQIKRLAEDMNQNGYDYSKPVDAWRNPETGRLEIQDGHHRTEAAKKADLDKIPVQVWE